jgi:hypothetical protein
MYSPSAPTMDVFNPRVVAHGDGNGLLIEQRQYTPKAGEVFRDSRDGGYWFMDAQNEWHLVDASSGNEVDIHREWNCWLGILNTFGPVSYVGTISEVRQLLTDAHSGTASS